MEKKCCIVYVICAINDSDRPQVLLACVSNITETIAKECIRCAVFAN